MLYISLPTKWTSQSKKVVQGLKIWITNEDTTKVTFQLAWPSPAAFNLQDHLYNLDNISSQVMKSSNLELEGSNPAHCQLQ